MLRVGRFGGGTACIGCRLARGLGARRPGLRHLGDPRRESDDRRSQLHRRDATSSTLCYASGLAPRSGTKASGLDLVAFGRPSPSSACGFVADDFEGCDLAAWSAPTVAVEQARLPITTAIDWPTAPLPPPFSPIASGALLTVLVTDCHRAGFGATSRFDEGSLSIDLRGGRKARIVSRRACTFAPTRSMSPRAIRAFTSRVTVFEPLPA